MGHKAVFKIKTEKIKPELSLILDSYNEHYKVIEKVIEEKYEVVNSSYSKHKPFISGDIVTLNDKEFKILSVKKELSGEYIYEIDDKHTIRVENYDEWKVSLDELLEKFLELDYSYRKLSRENMDYFQKIRKLENRNWIKRLFNK